MGQMGHLFKKRKAVSFRGTAMLSLTVIVIPVSYTHLTLPTIA